MNDRGIVGEINKLIIIVSKTFKTVLNTNSILIFRHSTRLYKLNLSALSSSLFTLPFR